MDKNNIIPFPTKAINSNLSIINVAQVFLEFETMSHKKLQSLCYYAQAIYIALCNKRLFEEDFEARTYGAISPILHDIYYKQDATQIINYQYITNYPISSKIYNYIKVIYDVWGNFTEKELQELIQDSMPWKRARKGFDYREVSTRIIKTEDMKSYYSHLYPSLLAQTT